MDWLLANFQLGACDWRAAARLLEAVLRQAGPRDWVVLAGLARAEAELGDGPRALRYARAAAALQPASA